MVHLPAVVAGEFGISTSEARRRIALGRVKVNGHVCTDLDLDSDALPDQTVIEMESRPLSDGIVQMFQAQQESIERPATPAEIEALGRGGRIPDEAMISTDWKPNQGPMIEDRDSPMDEGRL